MNTGHVTSQHRDSRQQRKYYRCSEAMHMLNCDDGVYIMCSAACRCLVYQTAGLAFGDCSSYYKSDAAPAKQKDIRRQTSLRCLLEVQRAVCRILLLYAYT
jgi:hypothetical protein